MLRQQNLLQELCTMFKLLRTDICNNIQSLVTNCITLWKNVNLCLLIFSCQWAKSVGRSFLICFTFGSFERRWHIICFLISLMWVFNNTRNRMTPLNVEWPRQTATRASRMSCVSGGGPLSVPFGPPYTLLGTDGRTERNGSHIIICVKTEGNTAGCMCSQVKCRRALRIK